MTDVRLTALNPEDSKVYPVACNSSGELLTDKSDDINLNVPGNLDVGGSITAVGSLSSSGQAEFAGTVQVGGDPFPGTETGLAAYNDGSIVISSTSPAGSIFRGYTTGTNVATSTIFADGSAEFKGDVVIGSRGSTWLIRESNGVAMLIEQTRRSQIEPRIQEVRDLPRELDLVEAALNEIMGKLKMTPPAGWPVWDGDE